MSVAEVAVGVFGEGAVAEVAVHVFAERAEHAGAFASFELAAVAGDFEHGAVRLHPRRLALGDLFQRIPWCIEHVCLPAQALKRCAWGRYHGDSIALLGPAGSFHRRWTLRARSPALTRVLQASEGWQWAFEGRTACSRRLVCSIPVYENRSRRKVSGGMHSLCRGAAETCRALAWLASLGAVAP